MKLPRLLVGAALVAAATSPARSDDPPAARAGEVFFRRPDGETTKRIEDLIAQASTDVVPARRSSRLQLMTLGPWAVDPLLAGVLRSTKSDPQLKCWGILTLDAICDARADRTDPTTRNLRESVVRELRETVVREDSNAYVGAFAALTLGRLRDAPATVPFRQALARSRDLELLRAAVPLALAKLQDPVALKLLREQLDDAAAQEPVASARLLALGFFPEAALGQGGDQPSELLAAALGSRQRRKERQTALLAFLVATARTSVGRPYLLTLADTETDDEVLALALVGLAASSDEAVTERLTRVAASATADDRVRELACDLLIPRGHVSALPTLLKLASSQAGSRLRASATLALARIDAAEARSAALARVTDNAPLVRAAAAVAAARSEHAELRAQALAAIDARLQRGETDGKVQDVFRLARSVLSGERKDVVWPEVGAEVLFGALDLAARDRLLLAVNERAERSLDLAKIRNLQQNMGEINPREAPSGVPGLDITGEAGERPEVSGGGPNSVGAARTSAWIELRDLQAELSYRPYFTEKDLPFPPAAPTGQK